VFIETPSKSGCMNIAMDRRACRWRVPSAPSMLDIISELVMLNSESEMFIVFEVASFRVQVSAKIVVGRPIFGVLKICWYRICSLFFEVLLFFSFFDFYLGF